MPLALSFKKEIYESCKLCLTERIANASKAMNEAQLAANGNEKSSVGDKFETSRAMGQRDRDMYARQLLEAQNELYKIERLTLSINKFIQKGSLIVANDILYFPLTGIGKLEVNSKTVMVISMEAPLTQIMLGKTINEEFVFNQKHWKITELI